MCRCAEDVPGLGGGCPREVAGVDPESLSKMASEDTAKQTGGLLGRQWHLEVSPMSHTPDPSRAFCTTSLSPILSPLTLASLTSGP